MSHLDAGDVAYLVIMGTTLAVSVVSNVAVIAVVARNRKMWTVTNLLICNLAVSDVCLAGVILPQNLHDISHSEEFHEGMVACRIVSSLPIFFISCSIYTLVAMSQERLRAIVLHHRPQLTIGTTKTVIAGIWVLSAVICLPSMLEYTVYDFTETVSVAVNDSNSNSSVVVLHNHTYCGSNVGYTNGILNGIFIVSSAYLVPSIIIGVNYSRLAAFILHRSKQVAPETRVGNQASAVSKKKVKVVKMLVIIAALFAVCWLPYFTLLFVSKLTGHDESTDTGGVPNMLRITLAAFSASYNAWLYIAFNASFRAGFRDMFCCCLCRMTCTNDSSGDSTANGYNDTTSRPSHPKHSTYQPDHPKRSRNGKAGAETVFTIGQAH